MKKILMFILVLGIFTTVSVNADQIYTDGDETYITAGDVSAKSMYTMNGSVTGDWKSDEVTANNVASVGTDNHSKSKEQFRFRIFDTTNSDMVYIKDVWRDPNKDFDSGNHSTTKGHEIQFSVLSFSDKANHTPYGWTGSF